MRVTKAAEAMSGGAPTAVQLEKINTLAKTRLNGEQVYVFSLKLCDDQVDRDYERFDTGALPVLAQMFVGKTGVVDHNWSSEKQIARIFETQVVQEQGVSYLKAWAYIRRGGSHEEIIADIDAGIKKETSIGCAMGKTVCSICGSEYGTCGHRKGESYDGVLCCGILKEPVDAYEFSFVAVPAQPNAGVLKALPGEKRLKALAEEFGAQGEYRQLCKEAELGRKYQREMQDQVVRLSLALDIGVEEPVLRSLVETAGAEELGKLKNALQARLDESLPVFTQLGTRRDDGEGVESSFLI